MDVNWKKTTPSRIMKKIFKSIIIVAFSASISFSSVYGGNSQSRKPNFVYILADDAGIGDFGAYGQQEIQTPNLERMAKEGIVFTNHYAGSTVCAPSRSSLLTGQHTGHTYIRGNAEIFPEGQLPLSPETTTVAEVLQQAGMKTGIIGKWGLGGPGSEGMPNKHGFDYWFGYLCQRQAHSYYPDHLWRNDEKVELNGDQYTHDMFTEEALDFIRQNHENPFFLYLPYTIPHAKLQVPDLEPYKNRDWSENKKKYAAMITRMDSDIGRILALLKRLEIDSNTLVMFSSDNGPHAEGGADPEFFNSSGPFRGKKRDLYEGGIRIPLIARWPGKIKEGSRSDHVSAFWDILPTLADLAETPLPNGIDGISMVPTLLGNPQNQKQHPYLYWEFHELEGSQAVRLGNWKGVRHNVRSNPENDIELYDLSLDPSESRNIAEANKEIVETISKIMVEARTQSKEFPLIGKQPLRRFGPYNAWLFSIVLLAISSLLFLIARHGNRKEMLMTFKAGTFFEKLMSLFSWLFSAFLYSFSAFLPLWGESIYFSIGLYLSIIGLTGYTICQTQFYFKKPGSLMTKGFYHFSRNPKEIFTLVFWSGVAVATKTPSLFWVLVCLAITRYFVIRLEERVNLRHFEEEYHSYKNKVSRYLFGL
ncbi:sulfatase-like hydrolase/transferase [bacterium]|nr:sulfatase-like hydrolase/transferase [bacterium]